MFYNYDILCELIKYGVNVNLMIDDEDGWIFLMLVVGNDIEEKVRRRLENLNMFGCYIILDLFLSYGVNIN